VFIKHLLYDPFTEEKILINNIINDNIFSKRILLYFRTKFVTPGTKYANKSSVLKTVFYSNLKKPI